MAGLSEKTCVPCRGGTPPLSPEASHALAAQVDGWSVVNNHHIEKTFTFEDFKGALAFTNKVGAIAEDAALRARIDELLTHEGV